MEDKRKAVANNDEPRQRQRREREAEAVEDTATSGRTTTAGGNRTLQELPRVTAATATTPAVGLPSGVSSQFGGAPGRGGRSGHGGFSQATPMLQLPVGNLGVFPPNPRAPGRGGGTGLSQSQWRLPTPMIQPPSDTALGRGGGSVHVGFSQSPPTKQPLRNPADNGPPQHAQIGPPPLHTLAKPAPPPERQSSSRGREQQPQAELENLDAMRLQVAHILNNPFSAVRSSSANPAPERQSSSPGCYSNLFTSNGPPQHSQIGNAGAPQLAQDGQRSFFTIDQQRQLGLLRGQPSSSQARAGAPGCASCGARPTRVALKMPMCEACYRDIFMSNAPPQHAQIGSMLPSPVPSYNYAQTGNVRPEHALASNVSQSPVPIPSNAGAPQGQQQFRDSVVELLAATEPSPAGSQRGAYSKCEACRFSGDKACMFCHNPGPPPPPPPSPPGQS